MSVVAVMKTADDDLVSEVVDDADLIGYVSGCGSLTDIKSKVTKNMEKYELREVKTAADDREFLRVAVIVNSKDPNWVRPLDNDILGVFDPVKNEQFLEGEAIRWVLYHEGKLVGRIAAFYNRHSASIEVQPTGGCGFFECIDDQQAANVLFDAAREWLRSKGMEAMDGSVNFGDRLFWWGVLVSGFDMPIYGMNYNQPYFGKLFEGYGFQNYFNQHTYLRPMNLEVRLNEALRVKADRLGETGEYTFASADMKNAGKVAEDFRAVYNSAWSSFEGVKQLTSEHAMKMMSDLRPIIDPNLIIFAHHNGNPVGFFIMVPDLNQITRAFNGKLGLWQKLRLIWGLKIAKKVNRVSGLIFGVAKEYQGKGVEGGLIRQLEKYVESELKKGTMRYKSLELMWVGDFNPVMMRMCESYVMATKHRMHTTYRYLFDREKPFARCPRLGSKPKNAEQPKTE